MASLIELAAVIVTEGVSPDPETIHRAQETGIPLLTTAQDTFSIVAALAELGIQREARAANAAMRSLLVDLHLHTVLSACAEIEMIPPLIVQRALALHLDVIAITDHNSADNVGAVIEAAQTIAGPALTVLPGMEVTTREEAHMLSLFDTLDQVREWQEIVHAALPQRKNNAELFGDQYVVDATGKYIRTEERLLATATSLSVEQVVTHVNALGGICLPAHIDRPSYSIIASLGFVPPQLDIAGVEISSLTTLKKTVQWGAVLDRWGQIVNSDAHRLNEMAARTRIRVAEPTVAEIRLALEGKQGTRDRDACTHLTRLFTRWIQNTRGSTGSGFSSPCHWTVQLLTQHW